ncbi:hypothetical protein ACIGEZ_16795 [Streptomyces sp. NPDC085481]|uniref:hypothetical protein n=1 Tax=Streptomyces sp. NPDC085481 TaxID=3365727 RepID=UPI0037D608CC
MLRLRFTGLPRVAMRVAGAVLLDGTAHADEVRAGERPARGGGDPLGDEGVLGMGLLAAPSVAADREATGQARAGRGAKPP